MDLCKDCIGNDSQMEGHNDVKRDNVNLMRQLVSQPNKPQPDIIYAALRRHATTLDQSMRDKEASRNRSIAVGLETSDLLASRHCGYLFRLYETLHAQQGCCVAAARATESLSYESSSVSYTGEFRCAWILM